VTEPAADRVDELKNAHKPKPDKAETKTKADPIAERLVAVGLGDDVYPAGLARNSLLTGTAAIRNTPADLPTDAFAKNELRDAYPVAYADSVKRSAALHGVDPRFVLAVMRQESAFDTFAHSGASARGLMQLIMSTGATTAAETGRNTVSEDELFDPEISIDLGTRHLADLFKLFPEQPDAVAAAYNAGADNVRRWVSRSRSNSPDAYVPEIMFVQTKDYVAKVMTNYRTYQLLYTEDLTDR
jgi:soluble lytic murein transglycosylase